MDALRVDDPVLGPDVEFAVQCVGERPAGVAGLAVPGMPLGSPGMEAGNRIQPYDVIAFGPTGQSVFASFP